MINFQLQSDLRIIRMVVPWLVEILEKNGKFVAPAFPLPEEDDQDLLESWKDSLESGFKDDYRNLLTLLKANKLPFGYIEISEDLVDSVVQSISQFRLFIRESQLGEFTDIELETGGFSLSRKSPDSQRGYLGYLILAEIQERLVEVMEPSI